MDFSSAFCELQYMGQALEQGVAVYSHDRYHSKREQSNGHNNGFDRACHREIHKLRVACQEQQKRCLDSVTKLQHTAQYLARIGVVRRDSEHVIVRLFVHKLSS